MTQVSNSDMTTYCGLYCGSCGAGNGEVAGAAQSLKGVLDANGYAHWAPELAEQVPAVAHYPQFEAVLDWLTEQTCTCCRSGGGDPACAIRLCAQERGLEGCWACAEDDGCDKLAMIDAGGTTVAARQRIREVGLAAWVAEITSK